jgi:organic hydroperoxide reductase OsmC/OhrA
MRHKKRGNSPSTKRIKGKLQVKETAIDREALEDLVAKAHAFGPYSKATRLQY